jgi:hypothetical protein
VKNIIEKRSGGDYVAPQISILEIFYLNCIETKKRLLFNLLFSFK